MIPHSSTDMKASASTVADTVVSTYLALGTAAVRSGNYLQAAVMLTEALEAARDAGITDWRTGLALEDLTLIHFHQRSYDRAIRTAGCALAVYERCLGPQHPYIERILLKMAHLRRLQEKPGAAARLYKASLHRTTARLGAMNTECLPALTHLAAIYSQFGHWPKARCLFGRIAQIKTSAASRVG